MGTLYILVGQPGTRKSATIRALTGFARGFGPWRVATVDGDPHQIFIISASPQEEQGTFPTHIEAIKAWDEECDVLLALHPDRRASGFIEEIPEIRRREIRWVLLGMDVDALPPEFDPILPKPDLIIPDSRDQAANAVAHKIRPLWGWL